MSEETDIRDYHDTDSVVGQVSCDLNEAEAGERAEWVQEEFLPHLKEVEEIEDGFVQSFQHSDEALETVLKVVLLESRCCSDQTFSLDVPADETEDIRLTMTGPEGTKELARQGFFDRFENAPKPN